jgi:hypothetical protein
MSHNAAEPQAVSGQRSAKSTRGRECQGDLKLSGAPFSGTGQFIERPIANRPQDAILPHVAGLEPQRAGRAKSPRRAKKYEACPPSYLGNVTVNVLPAPGVLASSTAPLCDSAIHFTIASPNPKPPSGRERALSPR